MHSPGKHTIARGKIHLKHSILKRGVALGATTLVAALGLAVPTMAVAAPPGTPAPADPVVVFSEDFENGVSEQAVSLSDYAGPAGEIYSSDAFWLDTTLCNGVVLQSEATVFPSGWCEVNPLTQGKVRDLAQSLGTVSGAADPAKNHAVTAYTDGNNPSGESRMLQGPDPASAFEVVQGRFYVTGVDVAEVNCLSSPNHSRLFPGFVTDEDEYAPVQPIIACSQGSSDGQADPILSGSFRSAGFMSNETGTAQFLLRNGETGGDGNDFAYDNLVLLDATPSLYKSFEEAAVEVGVPTTLHLTVVNTSELSEKSGWSFTDNLPSGMTVAEEPNVETECSVDVTAEGSAIEVANGSLAQGAESCTISVDVVLAHGGDFTNVIEGATGLVGEPLATIRGLVPSMQLTKSVNPTSVTKVGQAITYTFVVTNDGELPLHDVAVQDPGPVGGTGKMGPIDCGGITELAIDATMSCTAIYTAGSGDLTGAPLKNVASASAVSPGGAPLGAQAEAHLATVKPTPLANTGGESLAGLNYAAVILLVIGAGTLAATRIRRSARA